jgi:DNA processing protein
VVSGLARGVDTLAHCGALDAGGTTVAVLPGPITFIYPPENEFLARDIMRNGALLAENSPMVSIEKGLYPQRYRWVKRNRITSGLSEALVVIEATDAGGSMHQIKFAAGQGRPIHILQPDESAPAPLRRGYEEAIASGARPFTSTDELLSHIQTEWPGKQSILGD